MYVTDDNNEAETTDTENADSAAIAVASEGADPAAVAVQAAKAEVDSLKSELFAKLDAISQRLNEQPATVPATDSRKPNNAASVTPDLAELSPVARIAAGYKS